MEAVDEQWKSGVVGRLSNALQSDDKRHRKKALEEISKEMLCERSEIRNNLVPILKMCLRCFSDKAEVCREAAVRIVTEAVQLIPNVDEHIISYILPVLLQRIGDKEINEPSEEVRLSLVILLRSVIVKCSDKLVPFIEDVITILSRTIPDPYPKIKKESCDCATELSKLVPQHVHEHTDLLIKPLLQNFLFQQYRIRSAAIFTVGTVIRYGKSKCIETVAVPLAERLFDSVPAVRRAVTQVVADWLCNLPDRYSFFHRLVPLVLTSLSDELEEIRVETWQLWENIGLQYAKENENDLKDKLDFLAESCEDYPTGLRRPNLGCRELVQRQLMKIVAAVCGDICDWRADVRIRAAQLVVVLLQHAEQHIMQHLARLLPTLVRTARDDESVVVENVERGCELLGHFVPAELWIKLLLPPLEDSPNDGALRILAATVRGAQPSNFREHIPVIAEFLAHKNICWSRQAAYQEQLLRCCTALISIDAESISTAHQHLFFVIISALGLTNEQKIADDAVGVLKLLGNNEKCDLEGLFEKYALSVLEDLQRTAESWSVCSSERFIFEAILRHSGTVFGLHADTILSILKATMKPDNDAEMRLKSFTILSDILKEKEKNLERAQDAGLFLISFLQDVAVPNMAWRAGRSAEAVRTACVACVWAAVNPGVCGALSDPRVLAPVGSALFPTLLALIEDQAHRSRLLALYSLCRLIVISRSAGLFNAEHIRQIYPVVLKRLDDVNDEVRTSAVEALVLLFNDLPADYSVETSIAHIETLYSTMLIHLDDPDEAFRDIMFRALKDLSHLSPSTLRGRLESILHNFRNEKACRQLLDHLTNIPVLESTS
ncbi:dynein axonemal assembly factor 5 [Schistocerca nitens]|uniref:dynein axonemal assembly factor 5 n=1 Tax=Schistocerca nitens TaxID=7011 RepID=UPI0021176001|nr:dynein axonemal assembly factor 5 [Schistocerca nitens]